MVFKVATNNILMLALDTQNSRQVVNCISKVQTDAKKEYDEVDKVGYNYEQGFCLFLDTLMISNYLYLSSVRYLHFF